jgi:hypothetical protein
MCLEFIRAERDLAMSMDSLFIKMLINWMLLGAELYIALNSKGKLNGKCFARVELIALPADLV